MSYYKNMTMKNDRKLYASKLGKKEIAYVEDGKLFIYVPTGDINPLYRIFEPLSFFWQKNRLWCDKGTHTKIIEKLCKYVPQFIEQHSLSLSTEIFYFDDGRKLKFY